MNLSLSFVRTFFLILSLIFMITFATSLPKENPTVWTYVLGIALGLGLGGLLIALDLLFKKYKLRDFNIATLGLFLGYLMATSLLFIFDAILHVLSLHLPKEVGEFFKIFILLFGTYLGVMMTLRASDEIAISIPFIKFSKAQQKTKDILLDFSALSDPRLIDLAKSGIFDKRLILPRFLLTELQKQEESEDPETRQKAKRVLEVTKKLETMPELGLRYHEGDFVDVKDPAHKILRMARSLDTDIMSSELTRLQMAQENVRVINLHALANALKPLMQRGESLRIKIQRNGKEEKQGVGYLEDGTMVVVNGGGEFIGESIQARVLSVKHSASGRMIFCNVDEDVDHKEYSEEEVF